MSTRNCEYAKFTHIPTIKNPIIKFFNKIWEGFKYFFNLPSNRLFDENNILIDPYSNHILYI